MFISPSISISSNGDVPFILISGFLSLKTTALTLYPSVLGAYSIDLAFTKSIGPNSDVDKCESIKKNINYFELGFFEIISNDFVRCLKCNKIIKNKKQYANNHYSRAHVLDKKHFTKNAKEKIAKTKIGKKHSIEHKKKISESVRSSYTDEMRRVKSELAIKNEFGGTISGRVIEYDHFGEKVNLQSSYELKVAKSLDENNIKWIRPKYFFWNDCNNKKHRYYPDFYLIDYDVYSSRARKMPSLQLGI